MERTKNIIISHDSAMSYWLHTASSNSGRIALSTTNPLGNSPHSIKEMTAFNRDFPGFGETPIHLLINHQRSARPSSGIRLHSLLSNPPRSSFCCLAKNLYISSPELCLVQMAASLTESQLALLATDLTADYYRHPETKAIEQRPHRVTSILQLRNYAESASGMRGSTKVLRALDWALEGSRSPMESKMQIIMRYPTRRGGCGMQGLTLNYPVNPGRNAKLAEQGWFCIDLADPAHNFGIEYLGDAFHQNIYKDRRRMNGLAALGWTILTLDKQQLNDFRAFEVFAVQAARKVGKRLRLTDAWRHQHIQLRRNLGLGSKAR